MTALTDLLGRFPTVGAYAFVGVVVLAESLLVVGVLVPTLTLLLTAGALARGGGLNLSVVIATAAAAVVLGDFVGHRTGRTLGGRLRTCRMARRLPRAVWERADALTARHGGHAVFVARFVPMMRTLVPHVVGATRLPYRRIAGYSVLAAPLWATAEAGAGYAASASAQRALTLGGPALAAAAAVLGAVVLVGTRRRRRARNPPGRAPTTSRGPEDGRSAREHAVGCASPTVPCPPTS